MRVQILGPVRAWFGDTGVDLGPPGQRAMLGLLALATGQPLSRAELLAAMWGEQPPTSATNMIQSRVKHLRRLLEPGRRPYGRSEVLPSIGDGYALQVPAGRIDLLRFRQMAGIASHARQRGNHERVVALLREALGLWVGPPLADVPFLAVHPKVVALTGERRSAMARFAEALLAVGAVDDALLILEEAVAEQPLDEVAAARLILAYKQAGRRAQAFDHYHQVRQRLVDELAVYPGPDLAAAHAALLAETGTPATTTVHTRHLRAASTLAVEPSAVPRPTPAQLPADAAILVGREEHLHRLDSLLARATSRNSSMICAVTGLAGVGKTALAIHWAHQKRDAFPDGQLHVDLRGFGTESSLDPVMVVRGFLDAFGIPPQQMPTGGQALIGLYRSTLAGRRVLIVLDNARDADQVRPLLPGTPGCMVVVTSRDRLTGLVATDGAYPLTLDVLSATGSQQFLSNRLGADRVAAEPGVLGEIIAGCGGLPLALAIVAARATSEPELPLAALAIELRRAAGIRDLLSG